jgi:hypothetical protein
MSLAFGDDEDPLDMDAFREHLTPGVGDYIIQAHLQPPTLHGFRGDLGSVNWLILHQSRAEEIWPGISSDRDILANLRRAFPVTVNANRRGNHYKHPVFMAQLAEAGVAPLPEGYHCRPLPCPQHTGICDRKRPAIALARWPLNMGTWLSAIAPGILGSHRRLRLFDPACNRRYRELDMVVWCFGQPRFLADPLPETATEEERFVEACAAAMQTQVKGHMFQVAEVYHSHDDSDYYCPWLSDDDSEAEAEHEPQTEQQSSPSGKTPGCWRCQHDLPYLCSFPRFPFSRPEPNNSA